MKYKYCPECDTAYLKSRLERERCIICGKPTRVVEVKRCGRYYLGYATMVLGAAIMVITRLWFTDDLLFWIGGIFVIIFGGAIILDANGRMAKQAARIGREKELDTDNQKSTSIEA